MDPADAADRRRTQAWMGPPLAPPDEPPKRSLRWMPNEPAVASMATAHARSPGTLIAGRYRLVRALGRTAQTETWEASQVELERAVAIEFWSALEPGVGERLLEQARASARVRHPHALELGDVGRTEQGEPFVVTELLAGETVAQLLARRGVIPWARAVALVQQLAAALTAAHQHGVIHGDLRPDNVVLVDTGQPGDVCKLTGFVHGPTPAVTPSYMSPEQVRGEQLDPRSDVYALGCLLFAMVTGEPPFVGDEPQVRWQQVHEAPRTLRERAPRQFIPDELEAVVARCLAKLPAQRFADTRELAGVLGSLASAAASVVGAQVPLHDPSASGARPMGYAGRPAPKSARELTNSYKPVNEPIVEHDYGDDHVEPARRRGPPSHAPSGMSPPAIVAATLAGVVAVVGFGVGMYLLVNRMIAEPPAGEASERAGAEQAPASEPPPAPLRASASPTPAAAPTPAPPPTPAAPVVEPPAEPSATPPPSATDVPKKAASKSSKPAEPPPEPPPEPEPQSEPEPKPSKPSVDPDSKAKDKIGHDELRDPWG